MEMEMVSRDQHHHHHNQVLLMVPRLATTETEMETVIRDQHSNHRKTMAPQMETQTVMQVIQHLDPQHLPLPPMGPHKHNAIASQQHDPHNPITHRLKQATMVMATLQVRDHRHRRKAMERPLMATTASRVQLNPSNRMVPRR
jgi:hypothetical protein